MNVPGFFMLWLTKNKFLSSRRSSTYILLFLLILFFVNTHHSYAQSNSLEEGLSPEKSVPLISLTPAESAWLSAHPTIRFGFIEGYSPYLMVDDEGNQIGIFVDIKDQLSRRLGVNIVLEQIKTIPELFNRSENKEIDVVNALFPQRADSLGLLQTKVFLRSHIAIYTGEGVIVEKLDDIRGKTVVIQKNVAFAEQVVQPYLGQIKIIHADTPVDGLKMISSQKADLFVGTTTHNYHVIKNRLFGIIQSWVQTDKSIPFVMGIRPDWPELVPILNKGLASFGTNGIDAIVAKWIGEHPDPIQKIRFTPEEKEWFAKNHTVRVRVANAEPYIFLREGKPQGIAIDLLNLISERTGLKFRFIVPSPSFAIDLERIARHESPDLISTIMRTPEREKFLLFTENYSTSPRFIFTRDDSEFVSGMEGLSGRTVAVVNSFVVHKYLEKNHPEIKLAVFKDVADSLKAVSSGKAFAFIGDLKFVPIMITRLGLHNLKVAAPSSLPDHVQAMATRNDWPELRSILDKSLGSISGEEKSAIISKWITVKFDYGIKPADVLKWILFVVGSAFVIIFFFLFWNRSLKKQVKERTHKLADSEERFRATFEQAAVGIAHVRTDGSFLRVNKKFCNIIGYSHEETLTLTFQKITHPDDLERDLVHVDQLLKGEANFYSMEKRYIHKHGETVWIHLTVSILRDDQRLPLFFVTVIKDISARKKLEEEIFVYQMRLKALASQLTILEEQEKKRIATELHDHIGQTLAFSRILVVKAKKYAPQQGEQAAILEELSQSLLETIRDTKDLVFDLSSPLLNELGLAEAIAHFLKDQVYKKHGIKTEFVDDKKTGLINVDLSAILFRNVRELLTNTIKHARATTVIVSMGYHDNELRLSVSDDGIGFDSDETLIPDNVHSKFGLFSIRERIEDFGGSFNIVSSPDKGCQSIMIVPLLNPMA